MHKTITARRKKTTLCRKTTSRLQARLDWPTDESRMDNLTLLWKKTEDNSSKNEEYSDNHEIDLELRNDFDFLENANFNSLHGRDRIIGLSNELNLSHLSDEKFQPIKNLVERFNDVYFLNGDKLTHTDIAIHEIETSTNIPINKRQYRMTESTKVHIDEQIDETIKQGIIKPSTSPWNAPVLCVPKKPGADGKEKYRIVVDFRALNKTICIPNSIN